MNGTCSASGSLTVTVTTTPTLTLNSQSVCSPSTVDLTSASVATTDVGTLSYYSDASLSTAVVSPSAVGAGTYYVQAVNGTCSASGSLTVTIKELPLKPLTSQDTIYCRGSELATMTVSGGTGIFIWYSDVNLLNEIGTGNSLMPEFILGTSVYYITENENGCEGPVSAIQITIIDCEIVIPSAFTPNGDEMNDVWQIIDLDEVYPDNQVMVYSRWGDKVYESDKGNYEGRPWDGNYGGNALPVGSYYYILDFGNGKGLKKGTISIIKK